MTDIYFTRPATREDAPAILRFIEPILKEYGYSPNPQSSESDLMDIPATYFAPGGWFYVLVDRQGSIHGTIGFIALAPGIGKIRKMYVSRELKGKGYGKSLLTATLSEAKQKQFTCVVLETTRAMSEAIGLYKRLGFREIHQKPVSPRCELVFALDLEANYHPNIQ